MDRELKNRLDKWVSKEYEWLEDQISKNIAKGKMSGYATDLTHHIILDLYKMKDEKITQLLDNGKLKYYVLSGAALQIKSNTSPFWHTWRKQRYSARSGVIEDGNDDFAYEMELDKEETLQDCLDRAISQLHFYQQAIFTKKFKEGMSLQQVHQYYNISKNHLIKDLNKTLKEIRQTCKNAV